MGALRSLQVKADASVPMGGGHLAHCLSSLSQLTSLQIGMTKIKVRRVPDNEADDRPSVPRGGVRAPATEFHWHKIPSQLRSLRFGHATGCRIRVPWSWRNLDSLALCGQWHILVSRQLMEYATWSHAATNMAIFIFVIT